MSGSLRLDAEYPTIEQEAPLIAHPSRAVEVFSHDDRAYLRIGPVEGADPAHGSYTLMLSAANAAEIAAALQEVSNALTGGSEPAAPASSLRARTHHNPR
jgi:hypothetical protein